MTETSIGAIFGSFYFHFYSKRQACWSCLPFFGLGYSFKCLKLHNISILCKGFNCIFYVDMVETRAYCCHCIFLSSSRISGDLRIGHVHFSLSFSLLTLLMVANRCIFKNYHRMQFACYLDRLLRPFVVSVCRDSSWSRSKGRFKLVRHGNFTLWRHLLFTNAMHSGIRC